jgi:hypothetical protein
MRTNITLILSFALLTFVLNGFTVDSKEKNSVTVDQVVGTYEWKEPLRNNANLRLTFYDNGAALFWTNGKLQPPAVWLLEGNGIHVKWNKTRKSVGIVNKDSIKIQYWIDSKGKKHTGGNIWKKAISKDP